MIVSKQIKGWVKTTGLPFIARIVSIDKKGLVGLHYGKHTLGFLEVDAHKGDVVVWGLFDDYNRTISEWYGVVQADGSTIPCVKNAALKEVAGKKTRGRSRKKREPRDE